MKKFFLLAIIPILALSGCKKDKSSPSYTSNITISGTKTTFNDMKYYSTTTYFISNYDTETNNNTIEITLTNPVIGDLDFSSNNYITLYISNITYDSKAKNGKITITQKDDTSISGTFSGTFIYNDTEVTITGSFNSEQLTQNI